MNFRIVFYLSYIFSDSSVNHIFFYYDYAALNKTEARDIFNVVILQLMFENIQLSKTDIYTEYFQDSILRQNSIELFIQLQKYVTKIIENKIYIKNARNLSFQQRKIINFFMSINCREINKKSTESLKNLCIDVQKSKFSPEYKEYIYKELFYIFIQECNYKNSKTTLEFYSESLLYLETLVSGTYIRHVKNYEVKTNMPVTFDILKMNHKYKKNHIIYFIKLNLTENILLCFMRIIAIVFNDCRMKNFSVQQFYNELKKTLKLCVTIDAFKKHKKINISSWSINLQRHESIFANKKFANKFYFFYNNDYNFENAFEFWLRKYFYSDNEMVKISKKCFMKLYECFYSDFQKFIDEKVIKPLKNLKNEKNEKIFIYLENSLNL